MFIRSVIVAVSTFYAASAAVGPSLPFNKKYDEKLLQRTISMPMPELLKEISKTTDIVLVPTRTALDKELPKTALETSPVVKALEPAVAEKVRNLLGDSHANNAVMITRKNPDIKVKKNTIFTNEFIDGYTLIHEYLHSLMNRDGKAPISNLETYRVLNKATFLYNKIFANRALLNESQWRADIISALEEQGDVLISQTAATQVEEVLIETILARKIPESSPHYNVYRVSNGKNYLDFSLNTIINNFNTSVDKVNFIENELKHLEGISEETRKADLARLKKTKDKYLAFRADIAKLQEFIKQP